MAQTFQLGGLLIARQAFEDHDPTAQETMNAACKQAGYLAARAEHLAQLNVSVLLDL